MVTHMKTTIEIADTLLAEARQVAERDGTTLRELVESGLRACLEQRQRPPARVRLVTFKGKGLHPDVAEGGWERIREKAYEGHGA
jgi:hypothetical protein